MTVIKGTITDATGQPLAGATITFTALQNTAEMLRSVATYITTERGEYEFTVTPGVYSVSLAQNGTNGYALGTVHIYDDSPDGTLNSFLNAKNIDTRPEALRQFEALAQQSKDNAEKAAQVLEDAINTTIKGEKGDPGDSGLNTVKTDGTTITGDGNTTPLALGPGEKNSIGTYVMAYCSINGSGHDAYGDTIEGSKLTPAGINQSSSQSRQPLNGSMLPGTWRLCCEAWNNASSIGLYQRIA